MDETNENQRFTPERFVRGALKTGWFVSNKDGKKVKNKCKKNEI